jgi:hypothetical protein
MCYTPSVPPLLGLEFVFLPNNGGVFPIALAYLARLLRSPGQPNLPLLIQEIEALIAGSSSI